MSKKVLLTGSIFIAALTIALFFGFNRKEKIFISHPDKQYSVLMSWLGKDNTMLQGAAICLEHDVFDYAAIDTLTQKKIWQRQKYYFTVEVDSAGKPKIPVMIPFEKLLHVPGDSSINYGSLDSAVSYYRRYFTMDTASLKK